MKNLTTKSFLAMLLAAFTFFMSCTEDEIKEIVPVAPEVALVSTTPTSIEKGGSFEVEFTITSPTAEVTSWTITELVSEADGTAVSKKVIKDETVTDFDKTKVTTVKYTYTASDEIKGGMNIKLTFAINAEKELSTELVVSTSVESTNYTGSYLATTVATTPFDGDYDNTETPYTVTIVDNEDGTITISDLTGGLYGEHYPPLYESTGVTDLPATLTISEEGAVTGENIPDDPGFVEAFGDGSFDVSNGTVDENGVFTYTFTNTAGDTGTVTLVKI